MNIKKSIACAIVSIENNAPSTLGKVFYILAILVDITFYYAAAAVLVNIFYRGLLVHLFALPAEISNTTCLIIGSVIASVALRYAIRIVEQEHHARGELHFRAFNDALDSGIYTYMAVVTAKTCVIALLALHSVELGALMLSIVIGAGILFKLHTWARANADNCAEQIRCDS